jgi:hypothetical protein
MSDAWKTEEVKLGDGIVLALAKIWQKLGTISGGGSSGLTNAELRASAFNVNIPNLDAGYDTVRPYALPGAAWSYPAALGGITSATAVTVKTAAGVGIKNYVNSMQLVATAIGVATEIAIRDGAGGAVLWRGIITTAGMLNGQPMKFEPPLEGSANTLLEVAVLTNPTTGAIYPNLQGYSSEI